MTLRIGRTEVVRESSALVVAEVEGKRRAFVADEDDQAIVEMDLETRAVVATTDLGSRPRDLLVLGDGKLAATLPDAAAVAIFAHDEKGLREETRLRTGDEPLALALDPEERTIWVSTGASHSLVGFDARTFAEREHHSLAREPRAVLATGSRVYVTHAAETVVSVLEEGKITTRDIGHKLACSGEVDCPSRRFARHAQAILRMGANGVVVPAAQVIPSPPRGFSKGVLCRPTKPGVEAPKTGTTGYGAGDGDVGPPVITDLVTLDSRTGAVVSRGRPPMHDRSCLLPRAALAHGADLLVACSGGKVSRYSGFDFGVTKPRPQEWFANGISSNTKVEVIDVPGPPSALARDGKDVLVWSTFARAVTKLGETVPLVTLPRRLEKDAAWLRGRELFSASGDSRISADGRACASCHIDGRDDGLTWRTPNGPRRTRLLAGELEVGPYGWLGSATTLEAHVKTTIQNLEGVGLGPDDLPKLEAYVTSLPAPPRRAVADRGKEIFAKADCGACHVEGRSDRMGHDVGTGGSFLTPTLAGVGTRGALMHDGRYKDLDGLLAGATQMGKANLLAEDERRALVRYLETL